MPMKVRPLPESSAEAPHGVAEIGIAGIDDDVAFGEHGAQQRDLLVDRLAGLHHNDDRTRRPDRGGESAMLWQGMIRSLERAGAFDESVGARRRSVEDGDAMAFFGDVEREVGTHHAKADQADVGVSHCASLFRLALSLLTCRVRRRRR